MALFLFTKAIIEGEPIKLFNGGDMIRDFTYVEDIVESISRLLPLPPQANLGWDRANAATPTSSAPYRILNIGNSDPVPLRRYISAIENELGRKAAAELLPMQPGDIPFTHADCSALETLTGYRPRVQVEEGVGEFVRWYKEYFYA
jgi:UDP-glucuronate 4-epimerase